MGPSRLSPRQGGVRAPIEQWRPGGGSGTSSSANSVAVHAPLRRLPHRGRAESRSDHVGPAALLTFASGRGVRTSARSGRKRVRHTASHRSTSRSPLSGRSVWRQHRWGDLLRIRRHWCPTGRVRAGRGRAGVERAAETIAYGLMGEPVNLTPTLHGTCDDRDLEFRILTGRDPIVPCLASDSHELR